MWEKKISLDGVGDPANLHDADNCYPWLGTCEDTGNYCSVPADCNPVRFVRCLANDCQSTSHSGLTIFEVVVALNNANFAGHSDWRVPNIKELQSIVDYGTSSPSVDVAFNGASCSDLTDPACSCTQSGYYWSSTRNSVFPTSYGWRVQFVDGGIDFDNNTTVVFYHMRAVRGAQ